MSDAVGHAVARRGEAPGRTPLLRQPALSQAQLPAPSSKERDRGGIDAAVAARAGASTAGIPVAAGRATRRPAAIGIGAIDDGDAFVSLGTSAQYFVTAASLSPRARERDPRLCHGLPGRWSQMAALLNGASCLGWAAALFKARPLGDLRGGRRGRLSRTVAESYSSPTSPASARPSTIPTRGACSTA